MTDSKTRLAEAVKQVKLAVNETAIKVVHATVEALQKSEHALAHTGKTVAAAPKAAKPASTKPTVRAKPAVKAKAVSTGA